MSKTPAASDMLLKSHKMRADKAWSERQLWQPLYDEAYEFAVPYRQPARRKGKALQRVDRLFDNTAIVSAFRGAGKLQLDLFPPGQHFFKLVPGAVTQVTKSKDDLHKLQIELDKISTIIGAFFQTGDFDTSVNEMCVDLYVGTAALLIIEGDGDDPVQFICIPIDDIAIDVGANNRVHGIFWKTRMSYRQIFEAFPKGQYSEKFKKNLEKTPEDTIDISQDFVKKGKRWQFLAYLDDSAQPIVSAEYRSQPVAVPRYYRVPGESYGRGPVLLALPTIKTLNKAMELTLKSAAIQMLGIWGYRPGGAFNPDTVRLGPGAFVPMSTTGGVLGPDLMRLDPAAGRMDVSQLITQELRMQVQSAMHDDRLPDKGATPVSASEIMARMRRISENYLGAFGRLSNEIVPVLVRRVIEIAYNKGYIPTDIKIDDLLVQAQVLSPIAAAIRSSALSVIVEFLQLIATLRGPQAMEMIVKVDDMLIDMGGKLGVPAEYLLSRQEREAIKQQVAQAAAQMAAAQMQQGQADAQQQVA
jgi:hypothetical protein